MSHIRKYVHDSDTTIPPTGLDDLVVEPDLTIVKQTVRLVARDEKRLGNTTVKLVKVQWSDNEKDCTWETEDGIEILFLICFEGMSILDLCRLLLVS